MFEITEELGHRKGPQSKIARTKNRIKEDVLATTLGKQPRSISAVLVTPAR